MGIIMDIEEQTIIVKPRKIVSNKEVLEEIKKLFQEELNTNPECISLYDLSQLIKKSCEQRCRMNERYKTKLNNILYVLDIHHIILKFDFLILLMFSEQNIHLLWMQYINHYLF